MGTNGPPGRIRLLGGVMDPIAPGELLGRVESSVAARRGALIANHNAHSLYLLRRDAKLRAFFEAADLIQIDSFPILFWGGLLGLPLHKGLRSTYLDWRGAFWALADKGGWRVFYLGGQPGVADRARDALQRRWPNVVLGSRHGYFDAAPGSKDSREVLEAIAAFDPQVLLVGMGMPRQERWIADNRLALAGMVVLSVGAAFDYEAGAQKTPPRWSGPMGLEWLFRLAADPLRLSKRYLIEPWFLAPSAARDMVRAVRGRKRADSPGLQAP